MRKFSKSSHTGPSVIPVTLWHKWLKNNVNLLSLVRHWRVVGVMHAAAAAGGEVLHAWRGRDNEEEEEGGCAVFRVGRTDSLLVR